MGVTRAAPWWLTWALFGGLVLIFTGERVLETSAAARAVATGLGVLIVVASLLWRLQSWRGASGDARSVESTLLVTYAGIVIALGLHVISSDGGMRLLGIEFADGASRDRYRVVLKVLWPIVLTASLLPALGAQLALGAHRHARAAGAGLEALRALGTAKSALTVALAGSFLFLAGYVTNERDRTLDVSYFKTSSPGPATAAMVRALEDPLRVLLFYPSVNPVKEEVTRYFRSLAASSGGRVEIEAYDRFAVPELARAHSVSEEGVVVLVAGERTERLALGDEVPRARSQLRRLDHEVQSRLMTLMRDARTVYFTTGHGELNDPASAGPLAAAGLGGVDLLRDLLPLLNLEFGTLGVMEGLAREVPNDAALLAILGPRRPFLPAELEAVDRYLARGGKLLLALEPESEFQLGPLERRLGLRYHPQLLVDDAQHVTQRGTISDRRLIVTDRFSSHSAVTTVSRAGVGSWVLFVGAGHLDDTPPELDPAAAADADPVPTPSYIVRSLPTTFADLNGNFEFDERTEQRRAHNLVAAVEPAVFNDLGARIDPGMRALVFADSELFTDAVLGSIGLNAALVVDALKWLGGEESLAGLPESEEDVPIRHTRAEDVAWFYSTILGAPALVLAFGLLGVYTRRRRRGGVPV